jgi:hypothetical protein
VSVIQLRRAVGGLSDERPMQSDWAVGGRFSVMDREVMRMRR